MATSPQPRRAAPDAKQILLGVDVIEAFHEAGIVPPDIYTAPGWCLRIDRDALVTLEVSLVIPFDRLRDALDIIAKKRQEDEQRVHDDG
jgi:hypothetical protein